MNTKKQGDIGVGRVICYYTSIGSTVCIPLTDSQDYDLVVEEHGSLKKVQVKRCTYKRNGIFEVSLTVKGGNRTSLAQKVKKFDRSKADIIAVVTLETLYIIPVNENTPTTFLRMGPSYNKFIVESFGFDAKTGIGTCL